MQIVAVILPFISVSPVPSINHVISNIFRENFLIPVGGTDVDKTYPQCSGPLGSLRKGVCCVI